MVHWAWLIVVMFVSFGLGMLIMGLCALSSQASKCEDCLLYEQFKEKRSEAGIRHAQEMDELSMTPGCGYYPGSLSDPRD
jgi:hypothetical protein